MLSEQSFMSIAIEELFSHYMAQIICLENYNDNAYVKAYVRLFDIYKELVDEYQNNTCFKTDVNSELLEIKCRMLFRRRREKLISEFINTIRESKPNLDINECVKEFYKKVDNQNVVTLADQILLYSYILNIIRKYEEREEKEGIIK